MPRFRLPPAIVAATRCIIAFDAALPFSSCVICDRARSRIYALAYFRSLRGYACGRYSMPPLFLALRSPIRRIRRCQPDGSIITISPPPQQGHGRRSGPRPSPASVTLAISPRHLDWPHTIKARDRKDVATLCHHHEIDMLIRRRHHELSSRLRQRLSFFITATASRGIHTVYRHTAAGATACRDRRAGIIIAPPDEAFEKVNMSASKKASRYFRPPTFGAATSSASAAS